MIKNNQQLTVTRKQAEALRAALKQLDQNPSPDRAADTLRRNALAADVERLDQQIAKYSQAVAGNFDVAAELDSVETVGEALVYARIATGITQDDLARQIGVKAQQIQRYEQAQYSTASLATLTKISNIIKRLYQTNSMRAGKA